jgi:hypothetical protein
MVTISHKRRTATCKLRAIHFLETDQYAYFMIESEHLHRRSVPRKMFAMSKHTERCTGVPEISRQRSKDSDGFAVQTFPAIQQGVDVSDMNLTKT